MAANIEVEIRGRLTEEGYAHLKEVLSVSGKFIESHEREMFLLRDYPGYSRDFVSREVDIRLRNTSGNCEIMLKRNTANGAREEISLKLQDNDLENAKKVVKAFGCKTALWMHRLKEVYEYEDIEWSLVICPKDIRYYEAEISVENETDVPAITERLTSVAKGLGLEVLDDTQTREFIHVLDTEVNKEVEL